MQSAAHPVQPPKAPWLQWLLGIPMFYLLVTISALFLGVMVAIGARLNARPLSAPLDQLITHETRLLQSIAPEHPVRFVADAVDAGAARLSGQTARHLDVLPSGFLADMGRIAHVVVRRGAVAFALLVPLAVVLLAAASDGLAQRELRKYGGDPESSFLYHHARGSVLTWIGLTVIAYLLMPIAIHPHLVLCVLAPVAGFGMAIAVGRFKKYL